MKEDSNHPETEIHRIDAENQDTPVGAPASPEGFGAYLASYEGSLQGTKFPLDKDKIVVGRHSDSDIFLDDVTVSRQHAEITKQGDSYTITDKESLNGTYLNKTQVEEAVLQTDDIVQIGKFKLVFVQGAEAG